MSLQQELQNLANPEQAAILQRFFKTGPGEYGAGDKFLGIKVPVLRKISKKYHNLQLVEVDTLINSSVHEERLVALFILIGQYKKLENKQPIYDFYVAHMNHINNWDLVDLSAPHIVGAYLFDKDKQILQTWAKAQNIWARRIAMIAPFYFIKNNEFTDALIVAKILLHDTEDLLHKAVGWMLREIGKRNLAIEEKFLKKHYKNMPRTMLRYAIEKFQEDKRQAYLKGEI